LSENCVFRKLMSGKSSTNCFHCTQKDWLNFLQLLFLRMERILVDWTPSKSGSWVIRNFKKLETEPETRGIVLYGGEHHVPYMVNLIYQIREIHSCTLPIDVFHLGGGDIRFQSVKWIERLSTNVRVVDLPEFFGKVHPRGWGGKPFLFIASRFKETVFLDADIVLLQSPDVFFVQKDFQEHRALFFNDRKFYFGNPPPPTGSELHKLATYIAPQMRLSDYAKDTRTYRMLDTDHEQESGVLVVDKAEKFLGFLACAKLLDGKESEVFYRGSYGDKEVFWLGMEMMKIGYKFSHLLPGSVGAFDSKKGTCGRLLHFDENYQPLWWNGGYKRMDKGTNGYSQNHTMYLTRVVKDMWYDDGGKSAGSRDQMGDWEHPIEDFVDFCISESERKPRRLEGNLRAVADKAVNQYIHVLKEYALRERDLRRYMLQLEFY
jgi:hypothetical protein